MWNRASVAVGLLGLSAGCAGKPTTIWWAPAQGRTVEVHQDSSDRLSYDFNFASGRGVSATGILSNPRTAIIDQCYEMDTTEHDLTHLGVSCNDWPERREVVLSLLALNYLKIEQDCFDGPCEAPVVIDPSALGITPMEVAKWAEGWPDYIGRGGVYD